MYQKQEVSIDFDGKVFSLETGRFAKFANGSVMARCGDTMVLVTATASEKEDLEKDFLPLQVEYKEKLSSGGKIPGGFLKRETKPSDNEVLIARLIDRPTRPLIPKYWRFETQVIATVYSYDPQVPPGTISAVAASAALMISDVPFHGPYSEVTIGRLDGKLVVNPSFEDLKKSDIDITVAGTDSAILMVEGECKEISEDEFLEVLQFAHDKIKQLNQLQHQLYALSHKEKREFTKVEAPQDFYEFVKAEIYEDIKPYVHSVTSKKERTETRKQLAEKIIEKAKEKFAENEEFEGKIERFSHEVLSDIEKKEMRAMILDDRTRLDGRKLDQIRPIICETGLLPRAHGSALFTRGETQALCTATLGTKSDEQMIDGLQPTYTTNFFLHYNFPPFSTGEVKRLGLGRREIGHGNLAERSLKNMIPSQADFPYVIRIISDVLESNGSSSMATVCGGTLALLDAGVPITKPIAGIAMGLIKEEEKVAILSDILGDEDHLGDMDFKVTGSADGITACQMDIKIEGLSIEIMKEALEQARKGRLHILGIMNDTLSAPKEELSPYAPRYFKIKIPTDTIGAVIGSGGETIRGIVKDTNTDINIEDDGSVTIAATDTESGEAAIKIIRHLTSKPEEGTIYANATVKEIIEGLGAIIEFLPKKQGLLHISQIANERIENVSDVLTVGEKIDVMLIEASRDGKFRLSRRAVTHPEGYVPPPPRGDSRNDSRGGDRRGGSRGNDRRR